MNYYDKIRDEFLEPAGLINKEETEGCMITFIDKYESKRLAKILKKELIFNKLLFTVQWYFKNWGSFITRVRNSDTEILGHPYDLREVMRWFEYQYYNQNSCLLSAYISAQWYIEVKTMERWIWGWEWSEFKQIKINLSKHLKDQDLKELYEVMKSIN